MPSFCEGGSYIYAPNFEDVVRAYWFRVVRPSVHLCVHLPKTVHARVLKFHIWIPYGKVADPYFFLVKLSPFGELCPIEKIRMKLCQQNYPEKYLS